MSKKKSMTMTLRDFHGGSIPSQLPLPSAPASTTGSSRPPDRPGSWGAAAASSNRPDHQLLRSRPGSAGAASASPRGLEEGPPAFLPNPPHIGLHFDEDERKPFDASSAPRRALATPDTTLLSHPPLPISRSEPKRPISSPLVPSPAAAAAPAPVPVTMFPSSSSNVGSAPNAWGLRKEVVTEPPPPLPVQLTSTTWSASRLAQASAVEKVSSGRWQSKSHEVESIRSSESTQCSHWGSGENLRIVEDSDGDHELERPRLVSPMVVAYAQVKERTLLGSYTERAPEQGRVRSPIYSEEKERNVLGFSMEETRPVSSDGRSERPKLNLLPRTKPLDNRDFDDNKVYHPPVSLLYVQNVHETRGSINPPQSVGADDGTRAVERPKLHLMPRTKTIEQPVGNSVKGSPTVFGGARPREMVLKERGMDVAASDLDMITPPNRARNELSSSDWKMEPQPGERAERLPVGQKSGKGLERKGYLPDAEKLDVQRTPRRNENQKNTRDEDKLREQSRADSDTWRKPVEQPIPDNSAPRIGKVASPLELARAFSRPGSDARIANQKSVPGQIQIPFSRLTEARSGPSQRQINGY